MNRLLNILILMCGGICVNAQNLVPNPGFEHNVSGRVTEWQQPQGAMYHYTSRLIKEDNQIVSKSYNGIHLCKKRPSEYFVIRLKSPLIFGKKYCARMKVLLPTLNYADGIKLHTIGWKFMAEAPLVHDRTRIYDSADVSFEIHQDISREFTELSRVFTASNNNGYLVIGKFFTNTDSIISIASRLEYDFKVQKDIDIKTIRDTFALLYPPMPDYLGSKLSKRKLNKVFKKHSEEVNAIMSLQQSFIRETEVKYRGKQDTFNSYYKDILTDYNYLTYFDDICISPVGADGQCDCGSSETVSTLKSGEVYRLNNVNFATDKWDLNDAAKKELDLLIDFLRINKQYRIKLNGHTDNQGDAMKNKTLSQNRAKACADYLVTYGIVLDRIEWEGYGQESPSVNNDTEEGRAINRRVEFILE